MENKQKLETVYYACSQLNKLKAAERETGDDTLYTYNLKNKNKTQKKYEIALTYKSGESGKVKARRIKFGYHGEEDGSQCDQETYERNRIKYGKILIDSENFDKETFKNAGGFFNPKFWDVNTRWSSETRSTQDANNALRLVDQRLKTL
jgi:hypothetical protein